MELIDDWDRRGRTRSEAYRTARASLDPRALSRAIGAKLTDFRPGIVSVHCYEDVDYRWIHVTFNETIDPGVALRVGEALAEAAGNDRVYFNSLRPRAVFFLLEDPVDSSMDIRPASQYGERLGEIRR